MRGVKSRALLAAATALVLAGCALPADSPAPSRSGLPTCTTLPREARETIALVQQGGPYPFPDNDDTRFGNYEDVLPAQKLGYYREYTVATPGINHRGARRLVTGGGADGLVDDWFYTSDHYETFCEISDRDVDAAGKGAKRDV